MLMSSIPKGRRHEPIQCRAAVVPAPRVGAPAGPSRMGCRPDHRAHPPASGAPLVNVIPVVNTVRATLSHQAALAGADPAVAAAVSQVVEALGPALRLAAMDL